MEDTNDPPEQKKHFDSERDRLLYNMVYNGWANDSSGDPHCNTGFFARISNSTDEISEVIEAFDDGDTESARLNAKALVGHFLLYEQDGIIGVDKYDTHDALLADFDELTREYCAWLMEDNS